MECLWLSAALFVVGLLGALLRKDMLVILMSIELMLNAVNIAFVAFSRFQPSGVTGIDGQVMVLFVVAVAAAEAAVGLAIAVSIYKRWQSTAIDFFGSLKG